MIGNGESCELACNTTAGYQLAPDGHQPTCKAGKIIHNTAHCICVRHDRPCDRKIDDKPEAGKPPPPPLSSPPPPLSSEQRERSNKNPGDEGGGLSSSAIILAGVAAAVLLGGFVAAKKGAIGGRTSIMPSDNAQAAQVMAAAGTVNTANTPSPIFGGFVSDNHLAALRSLLVCFACHEN